VVRIKNFTIVIQMLPMRLLNDTEFIKL